VDPPFTRQDQSSFGKVRLLSYEQLATAGMCALAGHESAYTPSATTSQGGLHTTLKNSSHYLDLSQLYCV
jgi:hypothetical protein